MSDALDWALSNSPVMRGPVARALGTIGLGGRSIAVAAPLDPGTGVLAVTLADTGADVAVVPTGSSNEAIAQALARRRIGVYSGATWDAVPPPNLVIDTAAMFTSHLGQHRPTAQAGLVGVVETTTAGSELLGRLSVPFPVVATHRSRVMALAQRDLGRRVLQEALRLTNRRMAGTRVVVVGYGPAGHSVATAAAGLGATVTVLEPDPLSALQAHLDGHVVGDATWLPSADMVITTDGREVDVSALGDGTLMVPVGVSAPPSDHREVRPGVGAHTVDDRTVYVVGPLSVRSIDQADLTGAVAALALARLVTDPPVNGVHDLPADIDVDVATFALEALP